MHPLDGHISRLTHDNVCSDGRVAGAIHDWCVYAIPDQTPADTAMEPMRSHRGE